MKCKKRFSTFERAEDVNILVVKKDGKREPFDMDKLKRSMIMPCEKRAISIEKVEASAEKIEANLRRLKTKEIKSSMIGEKVMKALKKLDNVAYIRFAAVYKEFKDIDDFRKEIKSLKR